MPANGLDHLPAILSSKYLFRRPPGMVTRSNRQSCAKLFSTVLLAKRRNNNVLNTLYVQEMDND